MGKNADIKTLIESKKAEIISAFEYGESCQSLKKKHDLPCHETTILNYLQSWGVDTSPKYNPESWGESKDRNQQIYTLSQEGKSHREIAVIFDISHRRVAQILEKFRCN
jgi:transposase